LAVAAATPMCVRACPVRINPHHGGVATIIQYELRAPSCPRMRKCGSRREGGRSSARTAQDLAHRLVADHLPIEPSERGLEFRPAKVPVDIAHHVCGSLSAMGILLNAFN
jgi:hypothetical protein